MKKVNSGKYNVSPGEMITIKVTPVGVLPLVAASLNGVTLQPVPGTADTTPTYVFQVNQTSVVGMEFSFPGAPATAKYDTVITGSGGGDTGGFTIKQTGAIKDPSIRFIVG
jgi:hypothetical protein